MSRSYLHDRYMRKQYSKTNERNEHKLDEMPKNKPSKEILKHCSSVKVSYCEHSPNGHTRATAGRRQVNGIVRAGYKEEVRKIIEREIEEHKTIE